MNTNPGRIDKYELQELLGQGAITEVWKAFDTQARRYVAMKFLHVNLQLDPAFVTRFQRETLAISALHHPNIVQYYDFSVLQSPAMGNTTAYIVMDYVDGRTLADYTRNTSHLGKFLPISDIIRLFTSIGTAVDYAHQHGTIHGQLKPTNILLDKRSFPYNAMGEPVVTDFGMLKVIGAAAGSTSGWQLGTALYTSPEQIMGSPANERSDIYSLGIMLYEVCTGTPPFLGNNPAAIMMQHTNTVPALPSLINPGLPAALTTIIMRCIAKDPWARFPTASSLVEALTQAAGQEGKEVSYSSIPVNTAQPDYSARAMDLPTVLTGPPSPPAGMVPATATPSLPGSVGQGGQVVASPYVTPFLGIGGSSQPYSTVQPTGSTTPAPSTPSGQSAQSLPVGSSTLPPVSPPSRKTRRRPLWVVLAGLLILALIGSVLGAYFAFFSKGSTATAPSIVGHAYFVSSGLLSSNPESGQGITDELQIKLENIQAPQAGKSYYAWLLNDITLDSKAIPLGPLVVNNGVAVLSFGGDSSHSNLLATNSRLLITEEDSAAPPVSPSLESATWRYYAEFSQKKPNPNDPKSYSVYDHIRHLLADDPKVKTAGLTGGLDIWLYRNTQKILEWAGSARDAWKYKDSGLIHRQLIRIIDYLDGATYAQQDLPGQGLLVDTTIAKIGLLTIDPQTQDPPGYLYHIGKHLRELIALPDTSTTQRTLATQINQSINQVTVLFNAIKKDVLQLYQMPAAQLLGSDGRSLLDAVATYANDAFVGQVNPQAQVMDGVVQIHYEIQRMGTFDIRACTDSNPCSI